MQSQDLLLFQVDGESVRGERKRHPLTLTGPCGYRSNGDLIAMMYPIVGKLNVVPATVSPTQNAEEPVLGAVAWRVEAELAARTALGAQRIPVRCLGRPDRRSRDLLTVAHSPG